MQIIWLRRALQDMQRAHDSIHTQNPTAALQVRARLRSAVEHLEQFPRAGRISRKVGTREVVITEYPFVIRYRIALRNEVHILRIFHTATHYTNF